RLLATTPDTSAMTDTSTLGITYDSADHNVDMNAFAFQHVSDALAAQTLSGNVTAQLLLRELTANDNLKLTIKAYVVNNDGSSVVGTLLAITRDADEINASTATNQTFASTALSSYSCASGDRLVVEVGVGGTPSGGGGTQTHNPLIGLGCNAASGD